MRIALITETFVPNVNGVVNTLVRLVDYLERRGHHVMIVAPHDAPPAYGAARVVPLAGFRLPIYPELSVTPPQPGLTAHLRAFRPDLVHLANPALMGAVVPMVTRGLRLPLLASFHTNFPAYSRHYGFGFLAGTIRSWLRWIHNRCHLTLCPSSATLRELQAQGFRRLRVWGRGVDIERFHPGHRSAAWRERMGARPADRMLLYVGRLAPEKRLDMLAGALAGMDDVRLVLVGDGPARQELEDQLGGLPVTFTGYLQGADLAAAYASADAFVFPSDTDTFGQVVQEAMASGLPVIAARAGGALDLVHDGQTGLLVAPGEPGALRDAITALRADPARAAAMGRAGRVLAERRSWPVVLAELERYYRAVAHRRALTLPRRIRNPLRWRAPRAGSDR